MIEILTVKAWALETNFFNRMAPSVMGWLAGGRDISALIRKEETPKIEAGRIAQVNQDLYFSNEDGYFYQGENDQIIPKISLKGVVTKSGGLCSVGTRELGQLMQLNDKKKHVAAHIIEIDSPGGAVDGTPEFASVIAGLDKPVIAFVDGMAASAAYWVASQADHIVTNAKNYAEVGSIGTLAVLTNEKEYLTKQGIVTKIMRATASVDKARLNSVEEWTAEGLDNLQEDLDMINGDFIQDINTGRNGKLKTINEDIFTGKMYDQKKALALGMIDQIGTMEDAIAFARKSNRTTKTTNK